MNLYPLIKSLLFQLDAEIAHHFTIRSLKTAGRFPFLLDLAAGNKVVNQQLHRTVFGIDFPNPVGLAAGLDKNAEVVDEMGRLGFGFVEIGTVTPRPQPGNDLPRLFRLTKDRALINRMGFNNVGAEVAAARLRQRKTNIVIGANIGKNKVTPNEEAVRDYEFCFKALYDVADYFVVNVSSPNTPGLRALQDKDSLTTILTSLQDINHRQAKAKPILLKIAPDLEKEQLDEVVEVVTATSTSGIIATNTTIARSPLTYTPQQIEQFGAGGLSGAPLTQKSTEVVAYLKSKTSLPVVGVGGIMSAADAIDKFNAGCELVQLYTGFIYEGPALIHAINRALLQEGKN